MSGPAVGGGYRRTTTGMRAVLWIGAGFVAAAGLNEYLLSSQTDRYFAWTIKLPLTAAFLGGFYLTALGMAVLSARQREWSRARVGNQCGLTAPSTPARLAASWSGTWKTL